MDDGTSMQEERVSRFLAANDSLDLRARSFERMVGDASSRSYYRLHLEAPRPALVLALLPEPFDPTELAFLNAAELFAALGVRVPRVHFVAGDAAILVLEDLGDRLLQNVVEDGCSEIRRNELYREALSLLARVQRGTETIDRQHYQAFRMAFDEPKLFEELRFFREHFIEGLRGRRLASDDAGRLDQMFHHLVCALAERPRVLCHRDFHSRNLMLVPDEQGGEELAVIDFQDARLGPSSYDVVSLLRDSYVPLPEEFIAEMTEFFCSEVGHDLSGELDRMALQRNLKALGTFGFQIGARRNDVYRRYVDHTLSMVRGHLERHGEWGELRRVLARYLPELE